ncbi:hypothetical protein HPB47_001738 [Ixodes persulcatus]|uniref:Uncharacterized protein n=1 Tax=Ixodes persulcatus TaxID=34615 RepID=A0AC60PPC3_IXOPE|nr:hypothetical protein HPB47_001738 [Ixodes persulcatus]
MTKSVPNFLTVAGHHVMCEYQDMKRMRDRCGLEGHFGAACNTPRCNRCGAFGHNNDGCSSPYRWCGHNQGTTDCTQPRSYSAVARAADTTPGSLPTSVPSLASDGPQPAFNPSCRLRPTTWFGRKLRKVQQSALQLFLSVTTDD